MRKPTTIKLLILSLLMAVSAIGQIRIEIAKHPKPLLQNEDFYLASNLNNWNPGSPDYRFKRTAAGTYYFELPDSLTYFEYKITQGSWSIVEGNPDGGSRPNRIYNADNEANPKFIQVSFENWEKVNIYRFTIKKIPDDTPFDASIYLSGNFNNWNARDESYKLQKQVDGSYRVALHTDLDVIEYKFTRGSWDAVEGRESGKARPNRILKRIDNIDKENIEVEIASWEDLSGTFNYFSIYDLLVLFAAFQGFLLLFAIPTIQNYNQKANRWLVVLLVFTSVLLLVRTLSGHREIAMRYPTISLYPDFIMFGYAPIFYIYIEKLLFQSDDSFRRWALRFIPLLVQICLYLPFILLDNEVLKIKILNQEPSLWYMLGSVSVLGWLYNMYYWFRSYRTVQTYQVQSQTSYSYEENLQFLQTVLFMQAACLFVWFLTFFVQTFGALLGLETYSIHEKSIDIVWLAFSTIPHLLGYFAIHQPEIFKLPQQNLTLFGSTEIVVEKAITPRVSEETHDDNLQVLKEKVEAYMQKHTPFTNPKLTLNDLAAKIKIPPHILSKVINEGFDKNFFDFVNTYRIEEFKKRMEDPKNKNFTLLGIAFDVGFNSKTAFNRSFKKITNQTPSEYFQIGGE
ncbi:MAG: helix-turn-helix domain-containing protein [Spirosomaceae bacterium]|nr:helix-turn-helix domain-containing protein [Spirosomataceae bacterium]